MMLPAIGVLICASLASGERPEETADAIDAVLPEDLWAWQSLMQRHSPLLWKEVDLTLTTPAGGNVSRAEHGRSPLLWKEAALTLTPAGGNVSRAEHGHRLAPREGKESRDEKRATSRAAEFVGLVLRAALRAANQSLDPFVALRAANESLDPFGEAMALSKANATYYMDIWPKHPVRMNGDEGKMFFTSAPTLDWVILGSVCVALFLVDCIVIQRLPQSFNVHLATLAFWIFVAIAYNAVVWWRMGRDEAFEWCTGYFLEWILSMDNLFVFHLIFETYKTPPGQTHRAVFLGIVGAVVIRMVFFMLVSTLLNYFSWIRIPFGLLLIWSGIQAARGEDDDEDVSNTVLVRTLKWIFGTRLKNGYDDQGRLLVRDKSGRLQVTLLAMVVVLLELSDVIFALDSVSAKIAQIGDQYLAFSSTVIAMYGLRAMFFIVKDLVEMFEYLQYGLCLILVFIGIELIFARYIHLPSGTVFIVIFSVFLISTVASVARTQARSEGKDECEQAHEDAPSKSPANSEQ